MEALRQSNVARLGDDDGVLCSSCRRLKIGFTLLELLVVISVIALLTALLLPALYKAKSAAASTVCRGNLHQVGLALRMYLDDYGCYPFDWHGRMGTGQIMGMTLNVSPVVSETGLLPYLDERRSLWFCPAQEDPQFQVKRWDGGEIVARGYAVNLGGTGVDPAGRHLGLGPRWTESYGHSIAIPELVRDNEVLAPADMIAYGDTSVNSYGLDLSPYRTDYSSIGQMDHRPAARHNRGANILFCDGHVEYAKRGTWIARTESMRRRWNIDNEPHPETWE